MAPQLSYSRIKKKKHGTPVVVFKIGRELAVLQKAFPKQHPVTKDALARQQRALFCLKKNSLITLGGRPHLFFFTLGGGKGVQRLQLFFSTFFLLSKIIIYVYTCVYICMYVCVYIYIHTCIYAYMYVSMYVYMYIYIHTWYTLATDTNPPNLTDMV